MLSEGGKCKKARNSDNGPPRLCRLAGHAPFARHDIISCSCLTAPRTCVTADQYFTATNEMMTGVCRRVGDVEQSNITHVADPKRQNMAITILRPIEVRQGRTRCRTTPNAIEVRLGPKNFLITVGFSMFGLIRITLIFD